MAYRPLRSAGGMGGGGGGGGGGASTECSGEGGSCLCTSTLSGETEGNGTWWQGYKRKLQLSP